MSVRVHAIAKKVNKPSKELIEILTDRGYEIKSASASIDNITAQSIIDEFSSPQFEDKSKEEPSSKIDLVQSESSKEIAKTIPIVKSKADLDKEKREREEAELAEKAKLEKDKTGVVSITPANSGKSPSVPPPPSTRASAPPPPSTAGKSGVPSPPMKSASESELNPKPDDVSSEEDVVVEGNLILI